MKISFTKTAEKRLLDIQSHLILEFGVKAKDQFQNGLISFLNILAKYPRIGSIEVSEKEIRGFSLSKQTRLFYRIKKNEIIVLTLFDNRMNPNKKPK